MRLGAGADFCATRVYLFDMTASSHDLNAALEAAAYWHTQREQGLSPQAQQDFDRWLQADPAHAQALARVEQALSALRQVAHQRRAVAAPARPAQASPSRAMSWRPALAGACLSLMLALGVGWSWWHQPVHADEVSVAQGASHSVVLPDGSRLMVDADTRVSISQYRDRREVTLWRGQVFFEVAKDAERPFVVLAGPARVTVLGTRFVVRYQAIEADGQATQVRVEEGRVRVGLALTPHEGRTAIHELELVGGQALRVSADGALMGPHDVALASVAPWRQGLVWLDDVPLSQALQELGRYGPTGLVIHDPAVAALRLGGSYPAGRADELGRLLPQVLPVRLQRLPDGRTEILMRP